MMRRYHPALPTIAEAAEKPETSGESFLPAPPPAPFLSDHVPIYSAIPLEAGKNDRLFVLSWNVLEADFANGFSAPGRQGVYGENDAAKKDRHQHMANRLSSVLIGGMTDIVALQEITLAKNGLLDEIMKYESTHENYKPLTTRVNGEQAIVNAGNCIILYNHKTIIPLEPAGGTQPGCVIDFIHVSTGKKVKLLNAHLPYSENPAANEAVVKTFLTSKQKHEVAVVVGDFNCTVAPIHTDRINITTSVASTDFRYEKHIPIKERLPQGAYAIDGAFYSTSNSFICRQAKIIHTVITNMKEDGVYSDTDLAPLTQETIANEAQLREINQPRLAMMVDPHYQTARLCGDMSLSEYEAALQSLLNDENIVVRITKNLNNDTGIALCYLSRDAITKLKDNNDSNLLTFGFIPPMASEQPMRYAAVSLANFEALHRRLLTLFPALEEMQTKVLTKARLDAFTKIYTALRDGQTSLLKKNFLLTIGSMTDEAATASIEANIHRNPNSRTALAWKLAETHRTHCNDDNQALLKEIYKLCFEKSNFLSKSSLSGTSLWRSSKVNKTLEEKEITDNDRDNHSRSGKIAAALKTPKK
ncbi:MAG TPA: endonuclease/exonuclease/phosphatase family protein [Gammaproteobacteria bacterium]|nr:endonuclease/exonuclease/phosphatase family protein [Gammaproteobacteria bacterium]